MLERRLSNNLLGKGIDIATIAEVTGLTEGVIETFLTNREG